MSHVARVRSDVRGRGIRGIFLPELPRYKTRSQKFDGAVLEVYERILERFDHELSALDVAVDTVPRMRLDPQYSQWPDDVVADGPVPLGRLISAGVDEHGQPTRPQLIVFRRPVEMRADSAEALRDWLRLIIVRLVAVYLNVTPEQIDPRVPGEL